MYLDWRWDGMRGEARREMEREVRSTATGTGREFASAEVITVYGL